MRAFSDPLPIDEALPRLAAALNAGTCAVLIAPPGAGKTTRVPLALLDEAFAAKGKIIVLEPRRLAARAAARRMASSLGEEVGETIGLQGAADEPRLGPHPHRGRHRGRVRADDPRRSRAERRRGGAVRRVPRTLARRRSRAGAGARRAGGPARGFAHSRHVGDARRRARRRPDARRGADRERGARLSRSSRAISGAIPPSASRTTSCARSSRRWPTRAGSILVFLPGQGEIARVADPLGERVRDPSVDIAPLYGAMDARAQDRAVAPAAAGRRKIVLATSIAETSLTIEGVRVVIDSGLMRVPHYEPDIGLTRLDTVRVSRANADQRRGRAGRIEPGVCYRLWEEAGNGGLAAFAPPEILAADLTGLALDLAVWGVADPADAQVPRSAAARRLSGSARAAGDARRARRDGPRHRRGQGDRRASRCRRASRACWSRRRAWAKRGSPPRSPSCSPNAVSAATRSI